MANYDAETQKKIDELTAKYSADLTDDERSAVDAQIAGLMNSGTQTKATDKASYYIGLANSGNTASGTTGGTSSSGNEYEDYIKQLSEASTSASINALEAARANAVSSYATAQTDAKNSAADTKSNVANAAAVNQLNANEYAAANGLNIGAGSQLRVAADADTLGKYNAADTNLSDTLAEIQNSMNTANQYYDNQIAAAKQSGQADLAQQLLEIKQYQEEQAAATAKAEAAKAEAAAAQERSNAESKAALLASMGDYSAYSDLYGLTDAQVQALNQAYTAANTPTTTYSGGSSGGSDTDETSAKTMTFSQAQGYAEGTNSTNGYINDAVYSVLKSYGMSDADMQALYPVAWGKYTGAGETEVNPTYTVGERYQDYGSGLANQAMTATQAQGDLSQEQADAKLSEIYDQYSQSVADAMAEYLITSGKISQAQYQTWYNSVS